MTAQPAEIDPIFDPRRIGDSLDVIQAQLPIRADILRGSVLGDVLSRSKGDGFDMDGVRDYQMGDDPRRIDWGVTARHPEQWPQLREYYREITPSLWVVTDTLQSRYRVNPGLFSEQQLGVSAAMAFMRLAQLNSNPSSIIASSDHSFWKTRQPSQGKRHILDSAKGLAGIMGAESAAPIDKAQSPRFADFLQFVGQHCVEDAVILISDFRDTATPDAWASSLDRLKKQRNYLLCVELTNMDDKCLPQTADRFTGSGSILRLASGKQGQEQRRRYEVAAAEQKAAIMTELARVGAYYIELSTDEPRWLKALLQQLRHNRNLKIDK